MLQTALLFHQYLFDNLLQISWESSQFQSVDNVCEFLMTVNIEA